MMQKAARSARKRKKTRVNCKKYSKMKRDLFSCESSEQSLRSVADADADSASSELECAEESPESGETLLRDVSMTKNRPASRLSNSDQVDMELARRRMSAESEDIILHSLSKSFALAKKSPPMNTSGGLNSHSPSNSGLHNRKAFDIEAERTAVMCWQPVEESRLHFNKSGRDDNVLYYSDDASAAASDRCDFVRLPDESSVLERPPLILQREFKAYFRHSKPSHHIRACRWQQHQPGAEYEKVERGAENRLTAFYADDSRNLLLSFICATLSWMAESVDVRAQHKVLLVVDKTNTEELNDIVDEAIDQCLETNSIEVMRRCLESLRVTAFLPCDFDRSSQQSDYLQNTIDACDTIVMCSEDESKIFKLVNEMAVYRGVVVLLGQRLPASFFGKQGFETARLMTAYSLRTPYVSHQSVESMLEKKFALQLCDASVCSLFRWGVYMSSQQKNNWATVTVRVLVEEPTNSDLYGTALLNQTRGFLKRQGVKIASIKRHSYAYMRGCQPHKIDGRDLLAALATTAAASEFVRNVQ